MQPAESESSVHSLIAGLSKLRAQLRARLRHWLLKEDIAAIDCMLVQSALIIGTGETLVRQNALVLKSLEYVQSSLHAMRDSEERHYRNVLDDLKRRDEQAAAWHEGQRTSQDAAIFETKAAVDRLVELVTPKAQRLQGRRPIGGWDDVVAQNVEQFKETGNS